MSFALTKKWIVQRIEEHGGLTRTVEMDEKEAYSLYCNWSENIKRFNDQSVSLISIVRKESVESIHVNTEFKTAG